MSEGHLARWQDLVVIALSVGVMVAIGVYCARRTRSSDAYFLANRSMPGWVVAFSMMATIISSMTFLALPSSTFNDDWRFMPELALYFVPAAVAYFVFMPFFRRADMSARLTNTWKGVSEPGPESTARRRFSFITCFESGSFSMP